MSKKNLVRLMVRLFGDPAQHDRLKKHPAKTAAAAGLSPAERDLLLSGSDAELRDYLGSDAGKVFIKSKTAAIKTKTAAIKTATAAIKTKTAAIKTATAAIKTKTAAIKTATAAIKTKTAAIKTKTGK